MRKVVGSGNDLVENVEAHVRLVAVACVIVSDHPSASVGADPRVTVSLPDQLVDSPKQVHLLW